MRWSPSLAALVMAALVVAGCLGAPQSGALREAGEAGQGHGGSGGTPVVRTVTSVTTRADGTVVTATYTITETLAAGASAASQGPSGSAATTSDGPGAGGAGPSSGGAASGPGAGASWGEGGTPVGGGNGTTGPGGNATGGPAGGNATTSTASGTGSPGGSGTTSGTTSSAPTSGAGGGTGTSAPSSGPGTFGPTEPTPADPTKPVRVVRLRGGETATPVGNTTTPSGSCHPLWTHWLDPASTTLRYQRDRYYGLAASVEAAVFVGEMETFQGCPSPHGPVTMASSTSFVLGREGYHTITVTSTGTALDGFGSVPKGGSATFTYEKTTTLSTGTWKVKGTFTLEDLGTWTASDLAGDGFYGSGTWGPHG